MMQTINLLGTITVYHLISADTRDYIHIFLIQNARTLIHGKCWDIIKNHFGGMTTTRG